MHKRKFFLLTFFSGVLISLTSCANFIKSEKVDLKVEDIVFPEMLDENSILKKSFSNIAGFNGKTYTKPVTYYIHDKNSNIKLDYLHQITNYGYEISDDLEKFIVDTFNKIDKEIDLDFKRVNSSRKAIISIYKTRPFPDSLAKTDRRWVDRKPWYYNVEIIWHDSVSPVNPKLTDYPSLPYSHAFTLLHEISHALGLGHNSPSLPEDRILDPYDTRITSNETIMSYQQVPGGEISLSELDITALQAIWGVEKDN